MPQPPPHQASHVGAKSERNPIARSPHGLARLKSLVHGVGCWRRAGVLLRRSSTMEIAKLKHGHYFAQTHYQPGPRRDLLVRSFFWWALFASSPPGL